LRPKRLRTTALEGLRSRGDLEGVGRKKPILVEEGIKGRKGGVTGRVRKSCRSQSSHR